MKVRAATDAPATTRGANVGRRSDRACAEAQLRAEIQAAYERTYGRSPRVDQLDGPVGLVAVWIALERTLRGRELEDRAVVRSKPQIARMLGLPNLGTMRRNNDRYGTRILRQLRRFEDMGWIAGVRPVSDSTGRSHVGLRIEGISPSQAGALLFAVPQPRRRRRGDHPPRGRLSSRGQVSPPLSQRSRGAVDLLSVDQQLGRAGARSALARRDRAAPQARRRSAIEALTASAGIAGPEAVVGAVVAGVHPAIGAVAWWRVLRPDTPWRLKRERWHQLERSFSQAERVVGREHAIRWLVGEMEDQLGPEREQLGTIARLGRRPGDWSSDGYPEPASLGFFVVLFRRWARARAKTNRRRKR